MKRLLSGNTGPLLTVGSSPGQLPVEGKSGHLWLLNVPLDSDELAFILRPISYFVKRHLLMLLQKLCNSRSR